MLAAAASIIIFADAKAAYMPFSPTPDGFLRFANSLTFNGGTQYEFSNPSGCYLSGTVASGASVYNCTFDYRERSILGQRACRGVPVYYSQYEDEFGFGYLSTKPECSEWTGPTGPVSEENGQAEYVIAVSLLAVITGGVILFRLMQKED
jgi:hypothetical protein